MKTALRSSQNDFDIVVKRVFDVCNRQRFEYNRVLVYARQNFSDRLNKAIFRDFRVLISSFAFIKMKEQYDILLNIRDNNVELSLCSKRFQNIMNLLCAHIIQKRMIDVNNEKVLKFNDVNSH